MPIETLAVKWKNWGIRSIHAAVWYYYQQPPYDFNRLIEAAHRNGILVYAWLEWPYVGKKFWDDHPAWRQKNALLQDAHLDFLYLMDFQNSACLQEAMNDLGQLLKFDWDGIDIAEFSITGCGSEALEGPLRPEYFTGFSDTARAEFRKLHGFDQLELFDQDSPHYWHSDSAALNTFFAYRIDVNNRLLHRIVKSLDSLNRLGHRNWEIILTIVDNSMHSEFDQLLGYDGKSTVELIKKYHLTLEVEDPYMEWSKPPERYKRLGEYYRKLLGDHPFIIDINIVPVPLLNNENHTKAQPTGAVFIQLWKKASEQSSRVCFYSESTVFPADWEALPFAMTENVVIQEDTSGWRISTPYTVMLAGIEQSGRLLLDGRPWPCYSDEGIIIPSGEHQLKVSDTNGTVDSGRIGMRLFSISGELLECRQNNDSLEVKYVSELRCILVLNEQPSTMILDGAISDIPVIGADGRWAVVTPPGIHVLTFISRFPIRQ
jgi:hypothetical protein